MADIFNMTDTWNDGGTDFDAIKMAVTDTASGANSNIINCTIDGGHALKLTKNKQLLLADGSVSAPAIAFDSDVNTGFYRNFDNQISFVCNGVQRVVLTNSSIELRAASTVLFQLGNNCVLYRDDNNQLALRNGLQPQSFSIYNTYTSSSVYERLRMYWDSNVAKIETQHSGGSARPIACLVNNSYRWLADAGGMYFYQSLQPFNSSATVDIGTALRSWRNIYLRPSSSLTPTANGDLCIEATDNTTLTFKLKGSDGTVRSGTVALS